MYTSNKFYKSAYDNIYSEQIIILLCYKWKLLQRGFPLNQILRLNSICGLYIYIYIYITYLRNSIGIVDSECNYSVHAKYARYTGDQYRISSMTMILVINVNCARFKRNKGLYYRLYFAWNIKHSRVISYNTH